MQALHFLAFVCFGIAAFTRLVKGQSLPDCQTKCGNVTIEYPFGFTPGCYHDGDDKFKLTCDDKEKLRLYDKYEVISISPSGNLRILAPVSYECYDSQGKNNTPSTSIILYTGSLTLSNDNTFIGVGCKFYAYLHNGRGNGTFSLGCITICAYGNTLEPLYIASCQTTVPDGGVYLYYKPLLIDKEDPPSNSCIYDFLVENGKFNRSDEDDIKSVRNVKQFPVVLDWSVGEETCGQVGSKILCGRNSKCFDSSTKSGYTCICDQGFDGNPYIQNGCQGTSNSHSFLLITYVSASSYVPLLPCPHVNECTYLRPEYKQNCGDDKYCKNKEGSFGCNCPSGHRYHLKEGCIRHDFQWTPILLGTIIGFLVLLLGVGCIYYQFQRRKVTELRQQYFEQNGGGMLKQRLSRAGSSNVDIKIFTEEGMKRATNGYDESTILGEGGQGTVYKGILPDNSIVAIKKARLGDCSQVKQFINKVFVLSQINHMNIVKLLGCCLETEVPLLINEFVANGTLYDHLHSSMGDSSLAWERRLTIAIEVVGSLSYLHSSASIPIIHRDIKTANILLDEHLIAKVADFGASRLIPMDREKITTMVQGNLGYLDPEYYNSGMLNEKSDVYSLL